MRGDKVGRLVGLHRLCEQLLGQRLEDSQIAADGVEERQAPQHREEPGVSPSCWQIWRARSTALDLRRRPALDRSQEAEDQLQPQLDLHPRGILGVPSSAFSPRRDSVTLRETRTGRPHASPPRELLGGCAEIPRALEQIPS